MFKKLFIVLIVVGLLGLGYSVYKVNVIKKDKVLIDRALKVSESYISIYKGNYKRSDLKGLASEKVIDKIDSKYNDLLSLDNNYIDVDRYFYEYSEVGVKKGNSYDVIEKLDEEDDPRIFYKDGKPYIKLDDLDPYGYGLDGFMYKGVYLKVDTDKFELYSYDKIKKSLDFRFLFVDYKYIKDKGYIDIIYESVNKENLLKIRCYVDRDKGVVYDIEIFE